MSNDCSRSCGTDLHPFRRKRPRLRLEPEAYRQLIREVLARNGWRCQDCGKPKIFRSTTSARAPNWGMMPKRISLRFARAVIEPDTYIATQNRANREGDDASENRNPTLRAVEMARRTHRSRRSIRWDVTALGPNSDRAAVSKPRVGNSTLPGPTTLFLSFSRSSTIPSTRWIAPK